MKVVQCIPLGLPPLPFNIPAARPVVRLRPLRRVCQLVAMPARGYADPTAPPPFGRLVLSSVLNTISDKRRVKIFHQKIF